MKAILLPTTRRNEITTTGASKRRPSSKQIVQMIRNTSGLVRIT
jgi:hypothetical protein